MPISLTLSKRGGKEKISNSAISADNSQLGLQLDSSTLSSQESSKDWATGDSTEITKTTAGEASITGPETTDSANPAMKSIIGRSSAKQPLDPDSSSLGPIESAKEAKEKDKNKSWVKTIGMRTLRLRKNTDSSKSKAHSSSSHGIFSSQSQSLNQSSPSHSEGNLNLNSRNSEGGDGASGGGGGGGSTLPAGGLSSLETGTTAAAAATTTGTGSKGIFGKSKKSSSASASNGTAFREMLSSITQPNASPSSIHSSGADPSSAASGKQAGNAGSGSGTGPGQTGSNQETEGSSSDKQDPARFAGDGMSFKAKLIGVLEVSGPRGDRICQEALSELKMAVKAAGEHKQKITVHIALDGLRIRDEKTGDCLYHHQVHKISFIAQDLTDARAFGYIFGSPDMGHRFFGIKTEKSASQVVIAMRDLFQVVFDLKKKEIERAKQQLEMQQKFLATRAAETSTSAPKTDHKSSIAETYIEGACALGSGSLSSPGMSGHASTSASASNAVPEVDLLNLEVELNSLQEGLDNIHNNLADSVPFRGSTASISSDPMNPMSSSNANTNTNTLNTVTHPKFSMHGGNTNCNFTSTSGDPFGDSFDPFDNSGGIVGGFSGQQHHHQIRQNSQITSPSPVTFAAADPFAQIDPFPQPTFSNLESSDSFFNSDPFDTPGGGGGGGNLGSAHSNSNFSFSFGGEERGVPSEPQRHHHTSASSEREARVNLRNNSGSSSAIGNSVINNNSSSSMGFNSSGGASRLQNSNDGFGMGWQASFDDNFVMDMNGENANDPSKAESLDVFTELDPLGTGRVRPFVDRKDFFQDLKNPPRRVLKDLYATEGGSAVQLSSLSSAEEYNQQQQLQQQQSELQAHPHHQQQQQPQLLSAPTTNKVQANSATSDTINSIPNSFSTHFNPQSSKITTGMGEGAGIPALAGFDSAFKTALHASSMSSVRNQNVSQNPNQSSQAVTRSTRDFTASRSARIKSAAAAHLRSDSPPNYSPPPPPPPSADNNSTVSTTNNFVSNHEYFARPLATNTNSNITAASATPPPLLPPPSSANSLAFPQDSASSSAITRISPRTHKKSPQLLKQMTISTSTANASSSSSPKTLPRNARLGKQFTVDVPSSDENSPIPNLTPPPRPPHGHSHAGPGGTLGRSSHITLSTAVPRPYSGSAGAGAGAGPLSSNRAGRYAPFPGGVSSTPNQGPEPPPRPLQTTMISSVNVAPTTAPLTSSSTMASHQQQQGQAKLGVKGAVSLVSPPPLPPKKTNICPTLSNPILLSGSAKNLYTKDSRESTKAQEVNDLPLPLPSRKNPQWNSNSQSPGSFGFNNASAFDTSGGGNRYCVPPLQSSGDGGGDDGSKLTIKSSVIPRSRKSSSQSNQSNHSNYGYTSDLESSQHQQPHQTGIIAESPQKLTMEQALQQVASISLGQLAVKLRLPVDKLSNFTIQQLAEKLTLMEIEVPERHEAQNRQNVTQSTSNLNTSSHSHFPPPSSHSFAAAFESNFNPSEFDDDFSTMSAPGGFISSPKAASAAGASRHKTPDGGEGSSNNYDKYAVFRELTVEDASGFSLSSSGEIQSLGSKAKGTSFLGTSRPRPRARSGSRSRSISSDDNDDDPSQSTRTLNAPDQGFEMDYDKVIDPMTLGCVAIGSLDSRDSSSERTLQVEGDVDSGENLNFPAGSHSIGGNLGSQAYNNNGTNTMDDITDANLSDDPEQDPDMFFNDEVASLASNFSGLTSENTNSWATFESNFDDHFSVPAKPKVVQSSTVIPRPPIKLQSLKNKHRESPWDSDDGIQQDRSGAMSATGTMEPVPVPVVPVRVPIIEAPSAVAAAPQPLSIFDDKLLVECVLPPDPEEFNFQPFEKPSPIIATSCNTARRSSRDRDRDRQLEGVDLLDERPTGQFKRQSSGSSKHSVGKNSDYSDSGLRNRSRNNSREFDTWDRDRERGERDRKEPRDYGRSDSRNSYNNSNIKPPSDRERERKYRVGGGDSDEDFVGVPFKYSAENSRDSSLRRSGGSGTGSGSCSRSRPGSGKIHGNLGPGTGTGKHSRGFPNSNRTDDDNEEEEDEEDDDQTYNSYYSQSHSRRHHRVRYPNKYVHHHRSQQSLHSMGGTGPRKGGRKPPHPLSPERAGGGYSNSNHESDDFDDSYDEDEMKTPGGPDKERIGPRKRGDIQYGYEYEFDNEAYSGKDYYGNRVKPQQRRPGSGSSAASSGNKRYANIPPTIDDRDRDRDRDRSYRDSPREYYRPSGQGGRYHDRDRGDYRGRNSGRKYRDREDEPPIKSKGPVNEEDEDGGSEEIVSSAKEQLQYSDYSGEESPNPGGRSRGGNRHRDHRDKERERRYGGKAGGRRSVGPLSSRELHERPYRNCYTNSPSWDSESQSPDGANSNSNSGCERRKIRWGSSEDRAKNRDRDRDRDRERDHPQFLQQKLGSGPRSRGSRGHNQIQNPLAPLKTASKLPLANIVTTDFRFEDDFSFATDNKDKELSEINPSAESGAGAAVALNEAFRSASASHIPPQSPFEDNFVVVGTIVTDSMKHQLGPEPEPDPDGFDSIEFKRGATEEDHFSSLNSVNLISGDIFFPAKFDVDMEVEKESRRFNNAIASGTGTGTATGSTSMTPTPTYTPSSAELTRSSPSAMLIGGGGGNNSSKRLESIRSEEERIESSEDSVSNSSDKEVPAEDLEPRIERTDTEIITETLTTEVSTVIVSNQKAGEPLEDDDDINTGNNTDTTDMIMMQTNHDIICNSTNENAVNDNDLVENIAIKNVDEDLIEPDGNDEAASSPITTTDLTTTIPNNPANNTVTLVNRSNLNNNNNHNNKILLVETNDEESVSSTNMKKSESFNIFDRDKDPFADDDFFS